MMQGLGLFKEHELVLRLIVDNIIDEKLMLIKSINHMSIYALLKLLISNVQQTTWHMNLFHSHGSITWLTQFLSIISIHNIFLLLNSWCMKKSLMNKI